MKGFDEVYNVLFEHSFRYFGPESPITKRINDNNYWTPSISLVDNDLVNLTDENLRKDNCAYLNFHYISYYYIFDNLLTKIKKENKSNQLKQNENKSTLNKTLASLDELSLLFDHEELRKVMGYIGHLLVSEQQSLLDSGNYDYLALYFQIKKVWSVLITKRYLEDKMPIEDIRLKIKKSFAIQQLMEIEKAKIIIENYLSSFDEIYKTEESISKHINEFYNDFFRRYFCYIEIGMVKFLKDFMKIFATKFTTVDLLKEYSNTIRPVDEYHVLLIDYLQGEQNNLQNEDDMKRFLDLVDAKYSELNGGQTQELLNDSDDLNPVQEHNNFLTDENYNINETAEPMQDTEHDPNLMSLIRDENVLLNSDQQQLDDLGGLTFGTISTMTDQDQNLAEPSASTNETHIDQLDSEIDNPYQQIESIQEVQNKDDNQKSDSQETEVMSPVSNSNETENQSTEAAETSDQQVTSTPNTPNKKGKSPRKSAIKNFETLGLVPVETARASDDRNSTHLLSSFVDNSDGLISLSNLNENEDNSASDFNGIANLFINDLSTNLIRSADKAKKQRKETIRLIESDQDELGDLETIRRMENANNRQQSTLSSKNLPKNRSPIIVKSTTAKKPTKSSSKKRLILVETSSSEEDEAKRIKLDAQTITAGKVSLSQQEAIIKRQPILKLREYSKFNYEGNLVPIYD